MSPRVLGVEQRGRAAGDLRQGGRAGAGDRRAARHRLERSEAEALVQRRQDEHARAAVQRWQVVGADGTREHHAVADSEGDGERRRHVPAPAEAAGDDELMASRPLRRPRAGAQASTSRARFLRGWRLPSARTYGLADAEAAEQEVRALRRAGARQAVAGGRAVERPEVPVHALGRDQHALAAHAEQRAELVARVSRGHEHARRSRHRGAHAGVEHQEVARGEPLRVARKETSCTVTTDAARVVNGAA